jgi:ribonuclease III
LSLLKKLYNQFFSTDKFFVNSIKSIVGIVPTRISLYKVAFTHSSLSTEAGYNNERLEFLGDAVLDLVISEFLYYKYPFRDEGFLSDMRSKMVSRSKINQIAREMGLNLLVESTLTPQNLRKSSTLGNAFEALIGAIYLDIGYDNCKKFIVNRIIHLYYEILELENKVVNFKSKVFQYGQKFDKKIEFRKMEEKTTASGKIYVVALFVDDVEISSGSDFNKKNAEQKASELAFPILNIT